MNDLSNSPQAASAPTTLDDDDITAAIKSMGTSAAAQAVGDINENPNHGVQALQLSQSTGAPPLTIYGNLNGFSSQTKASMAGGLIRRNPQLQTYIGNNPLASVVSNDDWGGLDTFSRGVGATTGLLGRLNGIVAATSHIGHEILEYPSNVGEAVVGGLGRGAVHGFEAGFGLEPYGSWITSKNRWVRDLQSDLWPFEGAWRIFNGLSQGSIEAAGEGAGAGWDALTNNSLQGTQMSGQNLDRAVEGLANYILQGSPEGVRGLAGLPEATASVGQLARARDAIHAAEPWVSNGLEVPRGVHPVLDEAKTRLNADILGKFEQNFTDATAAITRDRSSPLFKNFVEQHSRQQSIGVSGDRVAELYGNSEPSPDDGLLGWVPNIADQLETARATGADVHIPISDWLTNADPEVAAGLHDDIRMWPGGITAREATEAPVEPQVPIDGALPTVRASASLEPMFSFGDRKLQLKRTPQIAEGMDEFQLLDQNQHPVGEMTVVPDDEAKQLYIANINGLGGRGPNDFGPALVKDVKRQLKDSYPGYETVTGHRVSGARAAAGVDVFDPSAPAHPVVKLSLPPVDDLDTIKPFHQILNDAYWRQLSQGLWANIKPTDLYTEHEQRIISAVNIELRRMVGDKVTLQPVQKLVTSKGEPLGAFQQYRDRLPLISWVLNPGAIGVVRHEAVHLLRREGFFTPEEWQTLADTAEREGWIDRYGIESRYSGLNHEGQIEESVADAFRDWAGNRDNLLAHETPVTALFRRLHEFFHRIRERIGKIVGRELTAEDLFGHALSGDIKSRGGTGSIVPGTFDAAYSMPDEYFDHLRANAAGLDVKSWKLLQTDIEARYDEDLAAAKARAEKLQAKQQTREWKSNRADLRNEIEPRMRSRPDIAADLFLGTGEINGQKLAGRYTLRAGDLTDEQRAMLPKHYVSKSGLPVQDVAHLFGYQTADELVKHLGEYNAAKAGLSPHEMLAKVINDETDRQMMAKYGNLDQNVMSEAQDQALSETNLNIMADEMYGAAILAGGTSVDKVAAAAEADRQFQKMVIGEVKSQDFMNAVAKHGRLAERQLIAGNSAGALVSLQRKFFSGLLAARARRLEKNMSEFTRTAKRLGQHEVKTIDPEYTAFARDILSRIGMKLARKSHDIVKDIAATEAKSLEKFVLDKTAAMREVPVWPELFNQTWKKPFAELTVQEFNAIHGSIKALIANGRDEMKINRAGEAADFANVKAGLIASLKRLPEKSIDDEGRRQLGPLPAGLSEKLMHFGYSHLQVETLLNHWDGSNPMGLWNQYVMRDLFDGANQADAWKKEFSTRLRALGDKVDLKQSIPNTLFHSPLTGSPMRMTRKSLRTVMLNLGTESNLDKLARGYDTDPDAIEAWVNQHALPEDWKFVQGAWDIFRDIKSRADTMYRSLSGGVAPESIPERMVPTRDGMIRGGYYPIIYHPRFEGTSTKLMGRDPLENDGYVRATTPAGYTKSRTGYAAPLAMDLDMIPGRISQMLHDIALRPAVINASKVFFDRDIRQAIISHVGHVALDQLIPYLRAVANSSNYMPASQKELMDMSEWFRQNLITTLIGLNPPTILKHGPSAMVTSIREVGGEDFLRAVRSMFSVDPETGESAWQFAIMNSLELQRRDRNWEESLYGATNELQQGQKFGPLRHKIMRLGAKPVALSDMLSSVPTWLAAYRKAIDGGLSHGDAVFLGDRAVRRAHGSTAITSRPAIMRDASPWLTSVYNYFNDILNRQAETLWKAGEASGLAKSGQHKAAMAMVPGIMASTFAYAIWPAIVEQTVSPQRGKEGWAGEAAKGMAYTLGASWIGVRDLMSGILTGDDPQAGLLGTAFKSVSDLARDMQKNAPTSPMHTGRLLQDASTFVGVLTGTMYSEVGRAARFGYGVHEGIEPEPSGPWGWLVGTRYGTLKGHSKSLAGWAKGTQQR